MSRFAQGGAAAVLALALATTAGCGGSEHAPRPETFNWVAQPITFSPPAGKWERQGDNSGGMLGVRFILIEGGGQCISVLAHRALAERSRHDAIERLISQRDSLSRREFLDSLSLARARTDDPISEREAEAARAINAALDLAMTDYLSDRGTFVGTDLEDALRAAKSYEPTLEEILPRIRLVPSRRLDPEAWRIGYEHDTTLAGHAAFASEDTLITEERPLLYHEIFWVVNGCAFKAVYQGTPQNLNRFYRVVDSIVFPDGADVTAN